MNEPTGIVSDTEPHEFEMIQHDENVEVCLKLDPPFFYLIILLTRSMARTIQSSEF